MEHKKGKLERGTRRDWELWIGADYHIADVRGEREIRNIHAERFVKCWNSHDKLLEACRFAEWVAMDSISKLRCPVCMNSKKNGHRHDCRLEKAIVAAK